MAMNSGIAKLVCLLLMISFIGPHAEAAVSCSTVLSRLSPCLGFLRGGGTPPAACCDGVKALYSAAGDRQAICNCVKSLVPSVGANPQNVNSIPAKCAVNIPYRYSPSLDCSKVH